MRFAFCLRTLRFLTLSGWLLGQSDSVSSTLPPGFHRVLAPPFVVVGDGEEAAVRARAQGTVTWAVRRLKEAFFDEDPEETITIWLFKDKGSYDRWTRKLFKVRSSTPYGYYSPADRALVMNIATGGARWCMKSSTLTCTAISRRVRPGSTRAWGPSSNSAASATARSLVCPTGVCQAFRTASVRAGFGPFGS